MVCQRCGTKQILKDELICPKCNSIKFLSKDIAINLAQKRIDWFDNKFKQVLNKFDKKRLLIWLFGEREKIATPFFTEIPKLELEKFISVNILIKRVIEDYELVGKDEANEKNTPQLIELFSVYIQVSEQKYLIEEDFGHYIAKNKFDIDNLDKEDLMSNFIFIINEDYIPVLDTFEDNLIMKKNSADKFFKEHNEEYDKIQHSKPNPVNKTPEEIIEKLFPALLSFKGALNKNKLYANIFNLEYLKNANISPNFILEFIKTIIQQNSLMTSISPHDFKRIIRIKFKEIDKNLIYKNLVITPENKGKFPLFLEIDNKILISHSFTILIGLFYYSLYYNDLFDKEIQKRSNEFEKIIVPTRLKEFGFKVISNYQDKKNASLEIDQIAWKNSKLYIIETKIWDLKPYFEHRKIHNYRERDLKGIVDGKEYSGEKEKIKPSLLEKIEYAKKNLSKICEDYKSIQEVKGIVITKMHSIINEYKGIKFLAFNKLSEFI